MSFTSELKELMEKHNVGSIHLTADSCSDWHGITGERMVITEANSDKEIFSIEGSGISVYDLKNH